ncbi:MAG: FAD-dependent thymidylate synthase [Parcubacteria group bacterium GW2011_GWA2_38_13b]|nr:MAG: FAD-dependent thymidylate synthase [Parcubacteria group bacterium GW2011_GWA2_38_13b]
MAGKKLKIILLRWTVEPELLVAMAAKLCYSPANIEDLLKKITEKDQEKFVEQLVQMNHMSPVEHIGFTFAIEGISRACTHQIVRHRVASYSQQSQRYVGEQSEKNEDGIFDFIIPENFKALGEIKINIFKEQMRCIQGFYDYWVKVLKEESNVVGEKAFEDARFLLPNAAETKIIITMNARELLHFFKERCCLRAQWEIRAMAEEMLRLAMEKCPIIFSKAGPACVNGLCNQGKMTCGKIQEVRGKFKNLKEKNICNNMMPEKTE